MDGYYFGTSQSKRHILVAYDIPGNRRRQKVSKILESFGKRVQKSVFECYLTDQKIVALKDRLKKGERSDDNVKMYYLDEEFQISGKETNSFLNCDIVFF